MNLNKYHSTGRLYTKVEAAERAVALFTHNYVAVGYRRGIDDATGLPRLEAKIRQYRNETKRQERDSRSRLRTAMRRGK